LSFPRKRASRATMRGVCRQTQQSPGR